MPKTRRKPRLPSQPDIPPPKLSVKPGNDFYMYVNGNWLRHANMPPYLSSYGVSEEIEQQIQGELMILLQRARSEVRSTADATIPHITYLLGTLTESILNAQTQDLNVKLLRQLVATFYCIRDLADVGTTIGDLLIHRIPTILTTFVAPMETDSQTLRLIVAPGSFGLPDSSYYIPGKSPRIISAYNKLLSYLAEDFSQPTLQQLVGLEQMIAVAYEESKGEDEVLYSIQELTEVYSHIPWKDIAQSYLGKKYSASLRVVVTSKIYLKHLNHFFRDWPIESWKTLFAGQLLLYCLPLLPPPYDDMDFELFGHRMRGQAEKLPQKMLALRMAQQWLRGSLGKLFVEQYVPPIIKQQGLTLAKAIRSSAAKLAGSTAWLDKQTQRKAAEKVNSIYLGVAYPSKIQTDRKTQLHPEEMLKNILILSKLDVEDELEKINTPLKREEWDDAVFAVNAYYYNEGNRLILPAGILRWPFFHPSASMGWNYGGLGATIGHEISHAFDADGKNYDEHGNVKPWWGKKELEAYNEKVQDMIELYSKTEYVGQHLNGVLTLSENIADLGGLAIALDALKTRLTTTKASQEERKKELCAFFVSYAVSWRTKEKKEKAKQALLMDVHAPPPARVNNIVSQFDEWYECFDVKPGDLLYKDPKQRIRIF